MIWFSSQTHSQAKEAGKVIGIRVRMGLPVLALSLLVTSCTVPTGNLGSYITQGVNISLVAVAGVPYDGGSTITAVPGATARLRFRLEPYGLFYAPRVTVTYGECSGYWVRRYPSFPISPSSRVLRAPGETEFSITFPDPLPEEPYGWGVCFYARPDEGQGGTAVVMIDPPR